MCTSKDEEVTLIMSTATPLCTWLVEAGEPRNNQFDAASSSPTHRNTHYTHHRRLAFQCP